MPHCSKRNFLKAAAGGLGLVAITGLAGAQAEGLTIRDLEAPSEADPGEAIIVSARVRNDGQETQTVTLEYRLAGQTRTSREVSVDAGTQKVVEFTPRIPSDLDPGTYQHGVFFAGTERGQTAGLTITGPGQPEYVVSNFRGPSQVSPGQVVTARAEIRNVGTASGTTRIQYRIADQVVASKEVTLDAGVGRTVTLEGSVPSLSPATYQQGVFVGDSTVGQSGSLVVGGSPARFEVLSIQAQSEATSGDRITATVSVRNTGDTEGTATLQYRIADRTVSSGEVTLEGGERATVRLSGTVPPIAAGTYTQGVFVGGTTNGLTARLTIDSPEASFSISGLSAPARAEVGDRATARVTVRNTGNASGSTTLQYRIAGTRIATREVSLDADESRTVTLEGTVPDRSVGTYQQGVFVGGSSRGLTTTLRIDERPAAAFSVSELRAPSTAEPDSEITVRATVTNTGNETGSTQIEYRIDGQRLARQRVDLRADRSTTVQFEVTVPDLTRGTYTQGVFVEGTARGQTTSLRIVDRPQFTVSGLQTAPSAAVGDRVSARATIRNRGESRATRTVEHRIGDRVLSDTDLQLDAGQSRTITLEGTVPNLAPGTYRHGIYVDRESATTSLDIRARPEPRPDISVRSFRGPSSATVGDDISVEATVRNAGNASGTAAIEYRIDDRILVARQVTLAAGAERTVTFDATVPNLAADTYQHGAFVAGTTRGQTRDLTVRAGTPRFSVGNLRGPADVVPGEEITVRAEITNTGTAAGETTIEYRLDGDTMATRTVDLEPGESVAVSFEVTVPSLDPGTYGHGVFVGGGDRGQTTSLVVERTPTPTPTPTETPGSLGPGFGPVAGLLGLGGAAGLARLYNEHLDSTPGDRFAAERPETGRPEAERSEGERSEGERSE